MVISSDINVYIKNSLIRGKLCKWEKPYVNVFITEILGNYTRKEHMYLQVKKAIHSWNEILKSLNIPVILGVCDSPMSADIVIHWVKVGRIYEGMCKYLSVTNSSINKVAIDIGLENEFSGKETTDLSIYCAIMHEFGHALGLGHGVDADDIMFVPHQKNISMPSENDIYVLKKIYL